MRSDLLLPTFALMVVISVAGQAYCRQVQSSAAVTISPETTYVSGPLNADGTVNYLKAFNERASKGVLPESNAAALLVRAMGRELLATQSPDHVLKLLGIRELAEEGDCFLPLESRITTATSRKTALEHILTGPWHPRQHEEAYQWLKSNRTPLEILQEAVAMTSCHFPLVGSQGRQTIADALIINENLCLQAGQALVSEAMLKLRSGDSAGCWARLISAHRLARLIARQPLLKTNTVALAIERVACGGDRALLISGRLQPDQTNQVLADMKGLPAMGRMTEAVGFGERCAHLSLVMHLIQHGPKLMDERILGATGPGQGEPIRQDEWQWVRQMVYWDGILKSINNRWDAIAGAFAKKTGQVLWKDTESFARETASLLASAEQVAAGVSEALVNQRRLYQATVLSLLQDPSSDNTYLSSKITGLIQNLLLSAHNPPLLKAARLRDQATAEGRLSQTAAALVARKQSEGEYPEKLSQLTPAQLAEVPEDLFSGKPLRYYRQGKHWLLYSVGPNGTDDGGRCDPRGPADDIAIILR